jgi:membrane protease YdiL (CAAX protease family)
MCSSVIGPSCTRWIVGLIVLGCAAAGALGQVPGADAAVQPENALTSPVTWVAFVLAAVVLAGLYWKGLLRRGALGGRDLGPHGVWTWLVAAGVLFVTPVLGQVGGLLLSQGQAVDTPRAHATVGLIGYAASIAVALVLARLIHASAPGAGFGVRAKHLALGVAAMAVCVPVVYAASILAAVVYEKATGTQIDDNVAHSTLRKIVDNRVDPWAWVMIGLAVVAAPIQEELLYRGFLQSAVLSLTRRPWLAVVLTSAVFAVAHRTAGVPWYAIVTLFVLSVCLGAAFERWRSIGVPIAMHMAFNAANVVLAMVIA